MTSTDIAPWVTRLAEVDAELAAAASLSALVTRTADRLFGLGKRYHYRGHDADGVATELGRKCAALLAEARYLRLAIDCSTAPERSLDELWAAVGK